MESQKRKNDFNDKKERTTLMRLKTDKSEQIFEILMECLNKKKIEFKMTNESYGAKKGELPKIDIVGVEQEISKLEIKIKIKGKEGSNMENTVQLMNLYEKAVQYYSAVNDYRYQIYMRKTKKLFSNMSEKDLGFKKLEEKSGEKEVKKKKGKKGKKKKAKDKENKKEEKKEDKKEEDNKSKEKEKEEKPESDIKNEKINEDKKELKKEEIKEEVKENKEEDKKLEDKKEIKEKEEIKEEKKEEKEKEKEKDKENKDVEVKETQNKKVEEKKEIKEEKKEEKKAEKSEVKQKFEKSGFNLDLDEDDDE